MRYIIIKKSQIMLFAVMALCLLISVFLSRSITQVMAAKRDVPITSVETDKMKISLTANVYENTNIEKLLDKCKLTEVTFFISEEVQNSYPEKVLLILSCGQSIGILEDNMSEKSIREINDRIAMRIETLAHLSGKNIELIRFDENRYDGNCIKAVYRLGLFPVQWSTDDTAECFSKGDIILISGESDTENFIKKTTADGYESVSLDELLIKERFKVDFRGIQIKE